MNYQARRRTLASKLPTNALAIIPAATEKVRNGDSHYRFRQASEFYYLTGFNEPDATLIISSRGESILFNRPRNLIEERWVGPRLGQEGAVAILAVDDAFSNDERESRLPELFLDHHAIYYPMGCDASVEAMIHKAWRVAKGKARRAQAVPQVFADLTPVLGEMRLIKDEAEIQCMREAAKLSIAAHEQLMRLSKDAQYEYELEAEFIYLLGRSGCREMAYDAIVAGGPRACTLHYTANNQALTPGELLLVDAGAEVQHYAADITRTYPINGTFSQEQRLIYELVWRAQKKGMASVRPGAAWDGIQKAVVQELTTGLVELGLLRGTVDDLIAVGAYQPFYMHNASHWLGLDVHDAGAYIQDGVPRVLKPGMTLTMEPGLYIASDCELVDEKWRGIGVRIEDDLLVTEDGYENLTKALVVSPDDVEELVRG